MGKTITIRIDEDTYEKIKSAAAAEKRTISNFMEYATMSFIERSGFVSNEEMEAILDDKELMASLQNALKDIEKGSYRIAETRTFQKRISSPESFLRFTDQTAEGRAARNIPLSDRRLQTVLLD